MKKILSLLALVAMFSGFVTPLKAQELNAEPYIKEEEVTPRAFMCPKCGNMTIYAGTTHETKQVGVVPCQKYPSLYDMKYVNQTLDVYYCETCNEQKRVVKSSSYYVECTH